MVHDVQLTDGIDAERADPPRAALRPELRGVFKPV